MRPELETYQLIDHFLNGTLEGDALHAFEQRMREDASFAEEVALQKITNAVVIGASYQTLKHEKITETVGGDPGREGRPRRDRG